MRDAEQMRGLVARLAARLEAMLGAPVAARYVEPDPDDLAEAAAAEERAARDAMRAALRQVRVDLIAVLRTLDELADDNALDDARADGVTGARLRALGERVDDLTARVGELAAQLIEGAG